MLKNKTHRIISISPNNHNASLKGPHNKSGTPIKPFQYATRSNTIKTKLKPDQSQNLVEQIANIKDSSIDTVFIQPYKQDGPHSHITHNQNNSSSRKSNLDEILLRIGKSYQSDKNNPSNQLFKKSKVNQLRQYIIEAKNFIKSRQQTHKDPFIHKQTSSHKIEDFSNTIKQKIIVFFSSLHEQLQRQQKALYQQLEEKIFELKEKNITKYFQMATLKSYIDDCEADVNRNYQAIINELSSKQLVRIVDSYTKKIQFYMEKIKDSYAMKLLPQGQLNNQKWIPKLQITIQKIQQVVQVPKLPSFKRLMNEQKSNIVQKVQRLSIASMQPQETKNWDLNKNMKKQQIGQKDRNKNMSTSLNTNSKIYNSNQSINARRIIQQIQDIPLAKILNKKINNKKKQYQNEPRIASARGRY